MAGFVDAVRNLSRFLNFLAGFSLIFIMGLTVLDVILRAFKSPIVGTYELVGFGGALVIGFAIPMTSWARAHIFVDFFVVKFSKRVQGIFNTCTRIANIALFSCLGWYMIRIAMTYQRTGEVSPTLQLPFYYVAFGIGVCCFVQCLVLVCDIVKIAGGEYE